MPPDSHWLAQQLAALPVPSGWCVAFSGGGDSTTLLHALVQLAPDLPLRALHVNHGIADDADDWENRCRVFCDEHGVPLTVVRVDASAQPGESPEDAARRVRYRAFEDELRPGECLLLAQHRDDQAETLLLQLIRGAGPRGLAGMPRYRELGAGVLARPLLDLSRNEIREYAGQHGLSWIDDPANRDPRYRRTAVRHELLPEMERLWPGVTASLARSARLCGEAAGLLRQLAETDLGTVAAAPRVLDTARLEALSAPRQRNLLRHWFDVLDLPAPQERHLDALLNELLISRPDATPCVRWSGVEVRRYRDRVFAMAPLPEPDQAWSAVWGLGGRLPVPGGGGVLVGTGAGELEEPVEVGFRRGGERLRPAGDPHTRDLRTLLQEAAVPPWERARLPVLRRRGEVLAVADLWITGEFQAELQSRDAAYRWERRVG